jgi:AcrR family transcriptional regulator
MAIPTRSDTPEDRPPLGRRDRRREHTRGQLTRAARTLIAEKGIEGLRIADVTEVADVGRGSFYNYFESKEDLVEAILSDSIQSLAAVAVSEPSAPEDPAVLTCIADRRFIRLASEDREFAQLLVNLNRGDDLFLNATLPYARAVIEPGIASGRFEVTDLDVVLIMLAGSAFALIRAILNGTVPPDAERAHAEAYLRLLGVPADEAREISLRPLPG